MSNSDIKSGGTVFYQIKSTRLEFGSESESYYDLDRYTSKARLGNVPGARALEYLGFGLQDNPDKSYECSSLEILTSCIAMEIKKYGFKDFILQDDKNVRETSRIEGRINKNCLETSLVRRLNKEEWEILHQLLRDKLQNLDKVNILLVEYEVS